MPWIINLLISWPGFLTGVYDLSKAKSTDHHVSGSKIKGVSLVASSAPITDYEFRQLGALHANFVCLLPYAFVKQGNPQVFYNTGHQWWGERPEGISTCISIAHSHNLQVMVKPQLWISNGMFTGKLSFDSEEEWTLFEESYSAYIFQLLELADSLDAAYFCIGTELELFVQNRKQYWSRLIDSARKIYDGKITYAENWDTYQNFPYWEKLDALGVNAYFPLSEAMTPSVGDLLKHWNPHYANMKAFSEKKGKPILFTEYGYRSIDFATRRPWESYTNGDANMQVQQNAYEALFQKFWNEPWIAGGFCWKWFDHQTPPDVPALIDFTPQNKPAQDVIRQWYSK